jgi:pimeloyl-ACP methyl ester carboxylesterase
VERTIKTAELAIELDENGSGIPIVGLHGLSATRRYVFMGSRSLERSGHRVITYDARGHGSSAAPPERDYDYGALSRDLGDVLDALELERAVLVGASMGAQTAVRYALEHPRRVAALALVTPAYDPSQFPARLERWDALSAGLRDGGIEGFLAAYQVERLPAAWRQVMATVIAQRLAGHRDLAAVADALAAVPRSRPFASFADLGTVDVPTVVVASRDEPDPEHPFATAIAYASAIDGAELVVEAEGRSPIAWQGGQLSRVVGALAARVLPR